MDFGESYSRDGDYRLASAVESCDCPTGYSGTSCEVNLRNFNIKKELKKKNLTFLKYFSHAPQDIDEQLEDFTWEHAREKANVIF